MCVASFKIHQFCVKFWGSFHSGKFSRGFNKCSIARVSGNVAVVKDYTLLCLEFGCFMVFEFDDSVFWQNCSCYQHKRVKFASGSHSTINRINLGFCLWHLISFAGLSCSIHTALVIDPVCYQAYWWWWLKRSKKRLKERSKSEYQQIKLRWKI